MEKFDRNRRRVKYCPCGEHSNRDSKFVPYVGYDDKGYCHSCGETFLPDLKKEDDSLKVQKPVRKKITSFIPDELFRRSMHYEQNNFTVYLNKLFGSEKTNELIKTYHIGTSKHQFKNEDFPDYLSEIGATTFWLMDITGKPLTGKIMLYDPDTGKRIKEPFDHVWWGHTDLKLPKPDLCFFGEHLLTDTTRKIGVVESEKTAIIASVYIPELIWISCGGLQGLTQSKCRVLKGRNVDLFPDRGKGYTEWSSKEKEFGFKVNGMLERHDELPDGADLADLLILYHCDETNTLDAAFKRLIEKYPMVDEFRQRMEGLGMKTKLSWITK